MIFEVLYVFIKINSEHVIQKLITISDPLIGLVVAVMVFRDEDDLQTLIDYVNCKVGDKAKLWVYGKQKAYHIEISICIVERIGAIDTVDKLYLLRYLFRDFHNHLWLTVDIS